MCGFADNNFVLHFLIPKMDADLAAMSVVELKKALKAKGLTTTGKKQDLIDRLQLSMATEETEEENIDNDLLEDADVLLGDDNDEVVVEPEAAKVEPTEPKKVAIKRDNEPTPITFETKEPKEATTDSEAKEVGSPAKNGKTDAERAAARAARFGASVDVASDTKKQARAERFGTGSSKIGAAPSVDLDTLKKRAERFGQSSATVMKKAELDEKLKKRQERFGVVTGPEKKKMKKEDILQSVGINQTLKDEKLLKRAERFGVAKA